MGFFNGSNEDDTIRGRKGDDTLTGNTEGDRVRGGNGDDRLI